MKYVIFFLLFLPIVCFSQGDQYLRIEGTNLSILPPDGFIQSTNFKGFQMDADPYSMIMVVEMPGPFSEIKKGFSKKVMRERGMKLITRKNMPLSDYEGIHIEMEQEANGVVFSKSILIYGDEDNTTIVNGMCLKENKERYPLIHNAIANIKLDETLEDDPRSELTFTLNEELIKLQFIGVVGNGMLFNRDGNIPTKSKDQLNIFVDKSFANVNPEDKKAFCINRLNQYDDPFKLDNEKKVEAIEIDGIKGFTLFAKNEEIDGEKMRQIIIFPEGGGYYIFNATFQEGVTSTIEDIDLFIKSFKVK